MKTLLLLLSIALFSCTKDKVDSFETIKTETFQTTKGFTGNWTYKKNVDTNERSIDIKLNEGQHPKIRFSFNVQGVGALDYDLPINIIRRVNVIPTNQMHDQSFQLISINDSI